MSTAAPALAESPDPVSTVIRLPRSVPPVLGLGAFLKNTVCLARGYEAMVSREIGNLDSVEALRRFEETVERLVAGQGIALGAVAHDLHPDFYSTRYARGLGVEAVAVQHHHAHVAAVMAEHGSEGPVLGLALDGFGLGAGDQSWGGELLLVDRGGYRRLGHMALLKQPGGDTAAHQPWRMGASALDALGRGDEIATRYGDFKGAGVIAQMLARDVNCPPTSSCGRLFDAACGLLGVKPVARFEGEAPMALEGLVTRPRVLAGGWRLDGGVLDLLPLLDRLRPLAPGDGADLFHGTLTAALARWVAWAVDETGVAEVVMSGGCMLNRVLREGLGEALARRRLRPLMARRLGPGDGAISLGQAWAVGLMKS